MTRCLLVPTFLVLLAPRLALGAPQAPAGIVTAKRFALVAGANRGADDRQTLRFAVSDASRFAAVMQELGGVEPEDVVTLRQPRPGEFEASLAAIGDRVRAARRLATPGRAVRTEVILYYSGHADEKGLLLGNDRLSYDTLRDRLDAIPADVKISVLDACASGAITRVKGGLRKGAFLVDASSSTRGQAFITSSSADENAQESDRIGGSYFTHSLLSGLRGAADASGDGRITLHEAYAFAFHETLGRTVGTQGGPQHPTYEIDLAGTGEVVLTDVRATTAGLVFEEALHGRVFVRDAQRRVVLECDKARGQRVALGLVPGVYEVHLRQDGAWLRASLELKDLTHPVLEAAGFAAAPPEPSLARGGPSAAAPAVIGRHHIDIQVNPGESNDTAAVTPAGPTNVESNDRFIGVQYSRFLREDLSLGVAVRVQFGTTSTQQPTALASDYSVVAIPAVVRWNPLGPVLGRRAVRPYLVAGIGPVFAAASRSTADAIVVLHEEITRVSVGVHVGTLVEFHVGRRWTAGVSAGWRRSGRFGPDLPALPRSGLDVGVTVGWLFGPGGGSR